MMKWFKGIVLRLLCPSVPITILIAVISTVLLLYSFAYEDEESPVSYVSYALSAYALTVIAVKIPKLFKKGKSMAYKNKYTVRYFTDTKLRARISLYTGLFINLCYAVFKLAAGIIYGSIWFASVACYYLALSIIRFVLLRNERKLNRQDFQSRYIHELRVYRLCGYMLLLLNVTITAMTIQMIYQNKGYEYPGFIIYASAAYTFYRFVISMVQIIKFRKIKSPVLSASKALNLCVAFMSIFALQTAMLTEFGDTEKIADVDKFCMEMNTITGTAVCFIVICISVFMIARSNKQIKLFNNSQT